MQSEFLKYSLNSNDNHLDELIKEIIPLLNSFRETKKKLIVHILIKINIY